jgi:phage tail sheath protein FI
MPVQPTYPGVYIEEIPSGVRTITGVATSVAAFVDFFRRGPLDKAVQLFNFGDFERELGGLDKLSEASYAIQQFFLNGGTEAWVVRALGGTFAHAAVQISNTIGGGAALTATAISPGAWGNNLRVRIDTNTPTAGELNLLVSEVAPGGTAPVRQELFRNLSMDSTKPNSVKKVVNDPNTGSKLIAVTPAGNNPPLTSGTLSGSIGADTLTLTSATPTVKVTFDTQTKDVELSPVLLAPNLPLGKIAALLEAAIRTALPAHPGFAGATVTVYGQRFHVLAGAGYSAERAVFASAGSDNTASLLKLLPADATYNAQEYTLGTAAALANTAQIGGTLGLDGTVPDSAEIIGSVNSKTGIYALEDVDLFNLLCLPGVSVMTDENKARAVLTVAEAYCEKRRAFLLVDTPAGFDEPQEIKTWLAGNGPLRHKNAALFYPRVRIPDPLDDFRLRTVGASGTLAGLFARTDLTRGVWKAPAGTEATLRNVAELDDLLTDSENGTLNPLAINCLRSFPVYGNVAWGARTLVGADQMASEWKYVPVRRLALFLEESLYRGTQWVVFEPNDEPLWSQIRMNIGAFMHNLFRQGAFQGRSPREAYLVKCDRETTTQNDIDNGIVNIVVGFAPLKPAEFVILKIQQLAGQIQT